MAFRNRWIFTVSLAVTLAIGGAFAVTAQRPPPPARPLAEEVRTYAGRNRIGTRVARLLAAAEDARVVGNCAERDRVLGELDDFLRAIDEAHITPDSYDENFRRTEGSPIPDGAGIPADGRAEFRRRLAEVRAMPCPPDQSAPRPPPVETPRPAPPPRPRIAQTALPCPTAMPARGASLHCRCPVGPYRRQVWGSYYYGPDSGLCAAALHAGVIGPNGGPILARVAPGRSYYVGKARNGIISQPLGGQLRTVTFDGANDQVEFGRAGHPLCQFKFSVYSAVERQRGVTCRCLRGHFGFDGRVDGSGPYTSDSSICAAARHAGELRADDGLLDVTSSPGRDRYQGSTRNGITSEEWSYHSESMTVRRAAAPFAW